MLFVDGAMGTRRDDVESCQRAGQIEELQIFGCRLSGCIEVERDGSEHLQCVFTVRIVGPLHAANGSGPAGLEAVLLRRTLKALPERIFGNVLRYHDLVAVHRSTTAPGRQTDTETVEGLAKCCGKAGSGADLEVLLATVQQHDAAVDLGKRRFQDATKFIQHTTEVSSPGYELENQSLAKQNLGRRIPRWIAGGLWGLGVSRH